MVKKKNHENKKEWKKFGLVTATPRYYCAINSLRESGINYLPILSPNCLLADKIFYIEARDSFYWCFKSLWSNL